VSFIALWLGQILAPDILWLASGSDSNSWISRLQPSEINEIRIVGGMATTTFTMIVALLFFLAHPRRQKLAFGAAEILAPGSHAANRVSEIAELFRISSPVCLVDSDIHHVDALAFGISGRRTILMGRGLLLLLVKRPNEFDVRLAHEIAHIKNGDVDLGYIALGMVTATKILFACLGIVLAISFGILSLGHFDSRFAIFVVIRDIGALILATILFAGLILPEYRSFLRSREFYADIAASHLFRQPVHRARRTAFIS
jgi:Zn-dependent protease with chaperone function